MRKNNNLKGNTKIEEVVFVLFDEKTLNSYKETLKLIVSS